MIGGPARRQRLYTVKPKIGQIERLDEHIDHANRIALFNPVAKAFRQQRRLPAIRPLNEAPHLIPPQNRAGIISRESNPAARFYTAWVRSVELVPIATFPLLPS